jgi:hypothetical protein
VYDSCCILSFLQGAPRAKALPRLQPRWERRGVKAVPYPAHLTKAGGGDGEKSQRHHVEHIRRTKVLRVALRESPSCGLAYPAPRSFVCGTSLVSCLPSDQGGDQGLQLQGTHPGFSKGCAAREHKGAKAKLNFPVFGFPKPRRIFD